MWCIAMSPDTGVIQPHMFEPGTGSKEEDEVLLVQGSLQVNAPQLEVSSLQL